MTESTRRRRASASSKTKARAKPKESATDDDYTWLGRIYDRTTIGQLPPIVPLIEGILELRTAVVMPGDTGTNKTFVAVGWACSIATGVPWLGRRVCIEPSTAILVVGEGQHGLDKRISAWEEEHGISVPSERLRVLVRPNIADEDGNFWEELVHFAKAQGSRFVALDTMSSLIPSMGETKEAPMAIASLVSVADAIDGTCVMLHHTGWNNQNRSRGGAQLEQNADAVIVLQKTKPDDSDSVVEIWRKKVKDGPSGDRMFIQRVALGESCVLQEVGAVEGAVPIRRFTEAEAKALILEFLDAEPLALTHSELEKKATDKGVSRARVRSVWKTLVAEQAVQSTVQRRGRQKVELWERA